MAHNANLVITYGDFTHDFNSLPEASLVAMLRRGVSHFRGNEQASKIVTRIKSALGEAGNKEPSKDDIKAYREANGDTVAKWEAEIQSEATDALAAGTVGVSTRGPSVDPLTAILNRLAKAEVVEVLKSQNITVPKKAEDTIAFPNGQKYTMAELVDRRKANPTHKDRLEKAAAKVHADQTKAAKARAEAAKQSGLDDL